MFVGVLKAIKGGKIEVEQKKSFLPDIHRVNMGLRGLGCGQYKRTTFKGFLCIFLKILAKDMGKPLVPAVPRHLGHLGHPNSIFLLIKRNSIAVGILEVVRNAKSAQ